MKKSAWGIVLALSLCLSHEAFAAEGVEAAYPNRPVKIIVPFPPGGATDVLARMLAGALTGRWGQQVLVDNRPGAGGAIGIAAASKAAPDGYTMLVAGPAFLVYRLYDETAWDPLREFIPITNAASDASVVIVHPGAPIHSLKDLVAFARANPGKLSYASAGSGTTPHLSMEFLRFATGAVMNHVPYQGANPAVTAVVGNQVPVASVGQAGAAVQMILAGKVRAIASTGPVRSPSLPDVPTFLESGFNLTSENINGVYLIAGTHPAIVEKVFADVRQVLQVPDMRQKLAAMGLESKGSSRGEFVKTITAEIAQWRKLVKEAGIKPE
jgi:tripartite-type tricarboxylate transporter receptor subunit TctC